MQFDVGTIHTGRITGITGYGAFVTFPENISGMLHISEISDKFVKDISEQLHIGDEIRVMIIKRDERGKLALSLKRVKEAEAACNPSVSAEVADISEAADEATRLTEESQKKNKIVSCAVPPAEYAPHKNLSSSFEDMMTKFKRESEEKISDLKKSYDSKRGSSPKTRRRN